MVVAQNARFFAPTALSFAAFTAFFNFAATQSGGDFRPNVLFIMADDLGFADLDWKDSRLYTPNLRMLAFNEHTVQLTNSYVNQLCTPTRSALMTGYYPFRTGSQDGVFLHLEPSGIPLEFPFLPFNLRRFGYRSYLVGKWHLGYCRREYLPTSRGFDYFYGYYGPQSGYFNHSAEQYDGRKRNMVGGLDLFRETGDGISTPDWTQGGVYSTHLFADETIRLLQRHDRRFPFFLFLAYQAVHTPLQVPRVYNQYCGKLPAGSMRQLYCGVLAAMDESIGKVVAFLKSANYYKETIIIFSSDNGGSVDSGASNAPLRGQKDSLWEGGTRTTSFVHAPAFIRKFEEKSQLFHVVDWHATILGMAGSTQPTYGDGINQWDYIRSANSKLRRFQFFYAIGERGSAVREGNFKLITGNPDGYGARGDYSRHRPRLFDLRADASESHDISAANPALVQRLLNKLSSMQRLVRRSIRRPLSSSAYPSRHNGAFSSYWC